MSFTNTILIPVSSNFFARNFLRTDAFRLLSADKKIRLVLLTHAGKVSYYQKTFGKENVLIDVCPSVRGLWSEWFFQMAEQASIVTSRSRMDQMTFLFRESGSFSIRGTISRLPLFLLKRGFRIVGRLGRFWRFTFRFVYQHFFGNHFGALFEKYKPTAVFAPTMVWAEDYCLLREAKRRGVKTIGMVFSWDTFYSKTFLRLHPDLLIVQTEAIRDQAVCLGDFPVEKISVTGITQYDRYFRKEGIPTREEFFARIGANPNKKLILYAFSGKAGLGIDLDVVDLLHEAIVKKEVKEDVDVLLRPYPRFDFSEEKLGRLTKQYGFLGERATSSIGTNRDEWEMDDDALSLLTGSLAHADVVITMYSTFFIEAAIFDRPLIAVAFDGRKNFSYWNSARRFFDWDHLKDIRDLGGITIAKNQKDFVQAINDYLKNPAKDSAGRADIVKKQCYYSDGRAGERLASAILRFL